MTTWYESAASVVGPVFITVPLAARWIKRQMLKRDEEHEQKVRVVVEEVLAEHMQEESDTVRRVEKRQVRLQKEVREYVQTGREQHSLVIAQQTQILARLDSLDRQIVPQNPQDHS